MDDVGVIDDSSAALTALGPLRGRLLAELREPMSAAALAQRAGIPRQKVNYHLRALESHGLVRLSGTKKWGGLVERELVATAASFVISPNALGPIAADPERSRDRRSASYLISVAARAVREVGDLMRRAGRAGQHLATLSVDATIRFGSASSRAAFTRELTEEVNRLAAKYHDESAAGGRSHRLVLLAHPLPDLEDEATDATGEQGRAER